MKHKIKFKFKTEREAKEFAKSQYKIGIEVLEVGKLLTWWYVIIRD